MNDRKRDFWYEIHGIHPTCYIIIYRIGLHTSNSTFSSVFHLCSTKFVKDFLYFYSTPIVAVDPDVFLYIQYT